MNLRRLIFAAILSSVAAVAQPNAALDNQYQIRYASNLQATGGDSYINISNTGSNVAGPASGIASGTTPVVPGTICANVYAFGPDEEILSCCSCPVTPNGLASLSAKNDLMNNILGRFTPNSIVIKLVASTPAAGTATGCVNSAAGFLSGATGMVAWGTTLHANTGPADTGHFGLTETPFTPASLQIGELNRLWSLCTFAQSQGSLHGICNSCSVGGLGAAAQ
jgi:hypothetical protein